MKSFCKKGIAIFVLPFTELRLVTTFSFVLIVKLVRIMNPKISPKFLIVFYFLFSAANIWYIILKLYLGMHQ